MVNFAFVKQMNNKKVYIAFKKVLTLKLIIDMRFKVSVRCMIAILKLSDAIARGKKTLINKER